MASQTPQFPVQRWWNARTHATRLWLTRGFRILIGTLVLVGAPAGLGAAVAAADDANAQSTAVIGWTKLKDSHGVPLGAFNLSINHGNALMSPFKLFFAIDAEIWWTLYLGFMALLIWFINWAVSFAWLDFLVKPAQSMADSLAEMIHGYGLEPMLLAAAGLFGLWCLMNHKLALGLFEIAMACFIAAMASGVLANPVNTVAGPDGALYKARDIGLTFAAGLSGDNQTEATPKQTSERFSEMLVDSFIRKPAQLVNFGAVIDGTKCEKAYDKAIKKTPTEDGDYLRDRMKDCNKKYDKVADNPGPFMVFAIFICGLGTIIFAAFAALLAGSIVLAGSTALITAIKLVATQLAGLLAGGARGPFWYSLAEVVVSLGHVVFATVYTSGFLVLIQGIFDNSKGAPIKTFMIADVFLIVGIVLFMRWRKRLQNSAGRLAQAFGTRPGGAARAPAQMASSSMSTAGFMARQMAWDTARKIATGRRRPPQEPEQQQQQQQQPSSSGRQARAVSSAPASAAAVSKALVAGSAGAGARALLPAAGGGGGGAASAAERVQSAVRTRNPKRRGTMKAAFSAAAAYATGGTSAVVSFAARHAASEAIRQRRANLVNKLNGEPTTTPARPAADGSAGPRPAGDRFERVVTRDGSVAMVPLTRPQRPTNNPPTQTARAAPPTRSTTPAGSAGTAGTGAAGSASARLRDELDARRRRTRAS